MNISIIVPYKEQLKCLDLMVTFGMKAKAEHRKVCSHMSHCPHVDLHCDNCIGNYVMNDLKKAKPELTPDNILEAIAIWEVVLK